MVQFYIFVLPLLFGLTVDSWILPAASAFCPCSVALADVHGEE
jgi:hypothetical protein